MYICFLAFSLDLPECMIDCICLKYGNNKTCKSISMLEKMYIMFEHRHMTLVRVPESDMMTAQIIRHKSHDLRQGGPTVPKLLDPKSNHCHRRS